jgi:hypothetical protein
MLTKEERGAIAERIKSVDYVDEKTFYESIVGKCVPSTTSYTEDLKTIFRVVLDLCDTSNMIELPLDKDGEVIHIGDTVYDDDNLKYEVVGYMSTDQNIILKVDGKTANILAYAETLTHKEPITIKSLAARIRDVLKNDYSEMSSCTLHELVHIANDLESLGDSND